MAKFDPDSPEHKPLNAKQLKTLLYWCGDTVAACRAAGYRDPENTACQLARNPVFQYLLMKKQEFIVKASAERLARKINICRSDVVNRLWEFAKMPPERTSNGINGQIKAIDTLAHMFDIRVVRDADLKRELENHTETKVDFFVEHGYFPSPEEEEEYAKQKRQEEAEEGTGDAAAGPATTGTGK